MELVILDQELLENRPSYLTKKGLKERIKGGAASVSREKSHFYLYLYFKLADL